MQVMRSFLAVGLLGITACAHNVARAPKSPAPDIPARFVGLYSPGFEQSRFRPCTRWGFVSGETWRIVFTDSALAERDRHFASLGRQTGVGPQAPVRVPLVVALVGRVSAEAPRALGVEPRRTILVDHVLRMREAPASRTRLIGLGTTCRALDRDDPARPARLASTR